MFNNAIAWASIHLRGGWKNYAWTTAGFATLLGACFAYYLHSTPLRGAGAMSAWNGVLFLMQTMILMLYGCTTIGGAIRRDITNGLIFSHRLMPISPAAAVTGYIFGPALQAMLLAAVSFVMGTAGAASVGLSLHGWFVSNASIIFLVLFLWVSVAFAGFLTKNAFSGLFGLIVSAIPGGGLLLNFVPALGVLMSPIVGAFMMVATRGGAGTRLTPAFGFSLGAQIALGAIFFRGAMRRYRRDDVPALGTLLSFLLLGAWVVTSAIGVLRWTDFIMGLRMPEVDVTTQALSGVVSSMVIALVSVSASAKASTEWMRTLVATGYAPGRRPLPPPLLAVLAAVVIFPLVLGVRPQSVQEPEIINPAMTRLWSSASLLFAVRVTVVIGAFLLSISYLLRILYRVGGKPFLVSAIWIVLTWFVPLGIEVARRAAAATEPAPVFSRMSPVGDLIDLWSHPGRMAFVGLAVQFCVAAVPGILFYTTEPKRIPKASGAGVA